MATEFITFCKKNGIKNVHIPANHPASNGTAERVVQVVKQTTKKMGTALTLSIRLARFLLMYHTTLHATTEMRPDELFLHQHYFENTFDTYTCNSTFQQQRNRRSHMTQKHH